MTQVLTLWLRRSVDLTALPATLSWVLLVNALRLKLLGGQAPSPRQGEFYRGVFVRGFSQRNIYVGGKQHLLTDIFAWKKFLMVSFLFLCCYFANRMFQFSFNKVFEHATSNKKFEQRIIIPLAIIWRKH